MRTEYKLNGSVKIIALLILATILFLTINFDIEFKSYTSKGTDGKFSDTALNIFNMTLNRLNQTLNMGLNIDFSSFFSFSSHKTDDYKF